MYLYLNKERNLINNTEKLLLKENYEYAHQYIKYLNSRLKGKKKFERIAIQTKINYTRYCIEEGLPFLLDKGTTKKQNTYRKFNVWRSSKGMKQIPKSHFVESFKLLQKILIKRYDSVYFIDASIKGDKNFFTAVEIKEVNKKEVIFDTSVTSNGKRINELESECAKLLIKKLRLMNESASNNLVVLTDNDTVYKEYLKKDVFQILWISRTYNLAHKGN
ncbi:MAG: hypothetical protein HRS57_03835 [Mycoplasmataceae bacterium]|nr:hypothetical protein [Mycoplasmataceae bacterium]